MKKTSEVKPRGLRSSSDMRREYRFDYAKAQPNRFAHRARRQSVVVLLAPDVAKVFKTGESVNEALRAILKAMPRRKATTSSAQKAFERDTEPACPTRIKRKCIHRPQTLDDNFPNHSQNR
jgi:hypothetical protein